MNIYWNEKKIGSLKSVFSVWQFKSASLYELGYFRFILARVILLTSALLMLQKVEVMSDPSLSNPSYGVDCSYIHVDEQQTSHDPLGDLWTESATQVLGKVSANLGNSVTCQHMTTQTLYKIWDPKLSAVVRRKVSKVMFRTFIGHNGLDMSTS